MGLALMADYEPTRGHNTSFHRQPAQVSVGYRLETISSSLSFSAVPLLRPLSSSLRLSHVVTAAISQRASEYKAVFVSGEQSDHL